MLRAGTVLGAWGVAYALLSQGVEVAILQSGEGGFYADVVQRFHKTLEQQGYALPTLTFVLKGDRTDHDLPRRILERKPKVILAVGTDAALRLKEFYTTLPAEQRIPVVFTLVMDPVQHGLIRSAEESGERFAGAALALNPQKQLRALHDVVPTAQRIGVIYNPNEFVSQGFVNQARRDAERLGMSLVEAHAAQATQFESALQQLQGKIDAFWVIPDAAYRDPRAFQYALEFSRRQRIPILAYADRFVRDGALVGAGIDISEQGALAAEQVIRILEGEPPERLPLLTPRRVLIYYNLAVAQELNISIPEMLINLAEKTYPESKQKREKQEAVR
ncbi:MAG: ABC transporter substrate-binding protein [Fimbriimonadales bacterium]|nr:ABC transporter substrate-binding protein [Fimbriimonadales bacterium]MDW8107101.1 ABC transporter substrate-binding protein [Armatimonadota bacterium]